MSLELGVATTPIDITASSTSIDLSVSEAPVEISTTDGPTVTVSTSTIEIDVVASAPEISVDASTIEVTVGDGGGGGGGSGLPPGPAPSNALLYYTASDDGISWLPFDEAAAFNFLTIDGSGQATFTAAADIPYLQPNAFGFIWPDTGGADVDTIVKAFNFLVALISFGDNLGTRAALDALWPAESGDYQDNVVGVLTKLANHIKALEP